MIFSELSGKTLVTDSMRMRSLTINLAVKLIQITGCLFERDKKIMVLLNERQNRIENIYLTHKSNTILNIVITFLVPLQGQGLFECISVFHMNWPNPSQSSSSCHLFLGLPLPHGRLLFSGVHGGVNFAHKILLHLPKHVIELVPLGPGQ